MVHSGLGKYTTDYSNLPQRYIQRKITKVEWKSPDDGRFTPVMRSFKPRVHNIQRPWTPRYWRENKAFSHDCVPVVEPIREEDWMWFRGDLVEVMKGPDKGKHGLIIMVVQERNWVIVQGLNCEFEVVGTTDDFPGIANMIEKPLLVTSDIQLVDPSTDQGSEVEWMFKEDGSRVRVARSGTQIPVPSGAGETVDYMSRADYKANAEKDTMPAEVEKITYEPSLATFEMDIMRVLGIKEDRIPRKSYWY